MHQLSNKKTCMNTLVIKNTKTLVILYRFILQTAWYWKFVDRNLKLHCKYCCKNTNIKIAFPTFKVGDLFSVKNSVPKYPKYFIVYRFTCPGCNASDIGETTHHLSKKFKEHLKTDSKPHIFKHLSINRNCKELCDAECF